MFIQSQQLVTNSSSGVAQSRKRKAEHYIGDQFLPQDSSYAVNNSNPIELNNASPNSQQPFVRASTIKLLDNYQRCGQKVLFIILLLIYHHLLNFGTYIYYTMCDNFYKHLKIVSLLNLV